GAPEVPPEGSPGVDPDRDPPGPGSDRGGFQRFARPGHRDPRRANDPGDRPPDAARRAPGLAPAGPRLQVALEVGGWAAILAYVHDGFGVGIVSEAAVLEPKGLIVRSLDPNAFPPIEARLIGRRLGGSGDDWDLSEGAQAWCAVLRRIAQTKRA